MKSIVTSYVGMFSHGSLDVPAIKRVEIPLIQRDYAQGREGKTVKRVRDAFLSVLHAAVTQGPGVGLDFVYGDVVDGTLRPLDGQQRLTTLFLLHWYLAVRADRLNEELGWKQFSYATRSSARLFCKRLVQFKLPSTEKCPSYWITDEPWYLQTWRHDPTIQSMLVMLDAIHQRFYEDDCVGAWQRLVDPQTPVITFHLLPMEQLGLSDELYIKMNSRGKPLTAFENFKARFEQTLESSCSERLDEFALKVDGAWSDLLWPYRANPGKSASDGLDVTVDDQFLRYFHFVTEVCEWREGRLATGEIDALAERVYGTSNGENAPKQLNFLMRAFDTWVEVDIAAIFSELFTSASLESGNTTKVVLFTSQGNVEVDLFSACCRCYGDVHGSNRIFSFAQSIFLYAVILHRIHRSADFPRRLRVLRNLVEASISSELRLERMPGLIADVGRIVFDGTLDGVASFNQAQVAEERLKAEWLGDCPHLQQSLFELEDHPVLQGCLAAFEFDAAVFESRANAFRKLFSDPACWSEFRAALLSTGDYSRPLNRKVFLFGSSSKLAPWRELLAGTGRSSMQITRRVLGQLLDAVAAAQSPIRDALEGIQKQWLCANEANQTLGWRYYFVKYPAMREGISGRYVGVDGVLGYSVCMLDKVAMHGRYRDPYLLAMLRASGVGSAVEDPWFKSYETLPRWMRLAKSGTQLRCVPQGIALQQPSTAHAEAFSRVCAHYCVGEDLVLAVPQAAHEGHLLDTQDRIQLGAALLRDLVAAGL